MFARVKLVVTLLSAGIVVYGLIGGTMRKVSAREGGVYGDLAVFTDVIKKVSDDYVEKPDLQKAMMGALHGMLEALDPYCSYVDRATYEKLSATDATKSPGVGLTLSKRYGYAYVVSVLPGSPADHEGMRSGDLIESVDNQVTTNMSLWETERMLLGPAGSTVTLRVVRLRRTEPSEVKLVRANINGASATARILEDGIGLLDIPDFHPGAAEEVAAKVKMLLSSNVKSMMVDLRGTAGGNLDEAIKVSELFLPKGAKILSEKNNEGKTTEYASTTEPVVKDLPIVVLINSGTSGPAEVFAAALQDHHLADMVGDRTNGHGAAQELFTLTDGSALMISTQLFYRPNGKPLQDQNLKNSGVTPDVRAPNEDFVTNFYYENATEDFEKSLGEDFYRKLNDAVDAEQFRSGLKQIRSKSLKKAA